MNRIYKTIRRAFTEETVVTSEHAKNQGKAHNASADQSRFCSDYDIYQHAINDVTRHQDRLSFLTRHLPFRLHLVILALFLALFSAIALTPAQVTNDLYIYSGGGSGGNAAYHGGDSESFVKGSEINEPAPAR